MKHIDNFMLQETWNASLWSQALRRHRLQSSAGDYPYLCNSVWATTPERLAQALGRDDLLSYSHPFDEAAMSRIYLHDEKAPLCVLRGAFGIHPTYIKNSTEDNTEKQLHLAAKEALAKALRGGTPISYFDLNE